MLQTLCTEIVCRYCLYYL